MNLKTLLSVAVVLLLFPASSFAQYQIGLIPRISPDRSVSQKIGFMNMTIKYGSPAVNNRTIWGDLVPYDKVWRAGANNATTISFSEDVVIGGQALSEGRYGLFVIPHEEKPWEVAISKDADVWGAFRYKPEQDVFRVDVIPQYGNFCENLEYQIQPGDFGAAEVSLCWANASLHLPVQTDYLQQFMGVMDTTLTKVEPERQWVIYLQGAEFLVNQQVKLELANNWLQQAKERFEAGAGRWAENAAYFLGHIYYVQSQRAQLQGDRIAALDWLEQLKAVDEGDGFYTHSKEEVDALAAELATGD